MRLSGGNKNVQQNNKLKTQRAAPTSRPIDKRKPIEKPNIKPETINLPISFGVPNAKRSKPIAPGLVSDNVGLTATMRGLSCLRIGIHCDSGLKVVI